MDIQRLFDVVKYGDACAQQTVARQCQHAPLAVV